MAEGLWCCGGCGYCSSCRGCGYCRCYCCYCCVRNLSRCASTACGTIDVTSAPMRTISRTIEDDTYPYLGLLITKIDSRLFAIRQFKSACCSSYSKSVIARRPFTTPSALCVQQKLTRSPSNGNTVMSCTSASCKLSCTMRTRSSSENTVPQPFLLAEHATATVTRGNMRCARRITSRWPRVIGSNVPGTTTWSIVRAGAEAWSWACDWLLNIELSEMVLVISFLYCCACDV